MQYEMLYMHMEHQEMQFSDEKISKIIVCIQIFYLLFLYVFFCTEKYVMADIHVTKFARFLAYLGCTNLEKRTLVFNTEAANSKRQYLSN